ncbi:BRO1-like domain-containing protein [Crucibulum laeve]|uniref:BRO1-like domain-containing protein n=1 Tax=Crucibulum laeve TaxID=68775 RepID=A0A5C3M7D6_9AGAR|nr:BRO1-like domain-containing protein [Crucibulum laeve]
MSNLLAIPFKKTYPLDLKDAVRKYISDHGGMHPDEFKDDIKLWQDLRKDGVGGVVHVNRVNAAQTYQAQLVSILAKLPTDIQLEIAYAPVFNQSSVPVILRNLAFERASVLFNLASLYSQLAAGEDRSTLDGIKRAATNYQQAAGTFSFLHSSALPKLVYSPEDEEIPLDLSESFIKGLEWLMLAQAQECSWQLAKINQYKNSLIAKIAARAASLYKASATTFREATPPVKQLLPSDWLAHIEAKSHHFSAVAEYRKSREEDEASRYGQQIARLDQAHSEAKKAYDIARRGKIAAPVLQDIQSLLEILQKDLIRAQRDNDLIYHQDVPAPSALDPIQQTNLATLIIPPALSNPASVIGNTRPIFGDLVGWGAREAINIYNNRKQYLIKEKVVDFSQELQDQADDDLRKLCLPAALEALERPIGLPPSLLRKAEEVRLENGPAKIEASIEDVQRLAHQDSALLDEALDILDNEASEDEAARKDSPLNRLPSHEANAELTGKATRYRSILEQAAASDETVRQKWDEWEENIIQLTWDEADLEASIPSTTISSASSSTPQGQQTRSHARILRVKLEELDTLHRERELLVKRARLLADADDIRPRILRAASGFERLTEVQPSMFEDVSDGELAKYDKFLQELINMEQKQNVILTDIKNRNDLFLQSRRDDPSVKEREHALQSLDLAYFKYKEITRNLNEGFKFYNDLAGILSQFKEVCKTWSHQRIQEIHSVSRSMKSLSLRDANEQQAAAAQETKKAPAPASPRTQSGPLRKPPAGKSSLGLPPIKSGDWGFEEIALPPGPGERK